MKLCVEQHVRLLSSTYHQGLHLLSLCRPPLPLPLPVPLLPPGHQNRLKRDHNRFYRNPRNVPLLIYSPQMKVPCQRESTRRTRTYVRDFMISYSSVQWCILFYVYVCMYVHVLVKCFKLLFFSFLIFSSIVQYSTVQYSTVQYSTVQYSTVN